MPFYSLYTFSVHSLFKVIQIQVHAYTNLSPPPHHQVCTRLQRILDATPPHTASVSYIQFDDGDELDLAESCSIEEFKCPLTLEVLLCLWRVYMH